MARKSEGEREAAPPASIVRSSVALQEMVQTTRDGAGSPSSSGATVTGSELSADADMETTILPAASTSKT